MPCTSPTLVGGDGWVDQTESLNSFSRDRASPFPSLGLYFLICTREHLYKGRERLDQGTRKAQTSVIISELAV